MLMHFVRGNTLIEARFISKQGMNNPYNLGVLRNFMHTFGEPGFAALRWLLPLPLLEHRDKYFVAQPSDILGVTYYPIHNEYQTHAIERTRQYLKDGLKPHE